MRKKFIFGGAELTVLLQLDKAALLSEVISHVKKIRAIQQRLAKSFLSH